MENRIKGFLSGHKGSLFALVMFLFFLLVIIFAKDIRLLVVNTTVDARFWPRIIGIGGCALSILLFVQSLLEERKRDGGVDVKEEEMDPDDKTRSIKTLLLMFLYILGLEYLGFVIMTRTTIIRLLLVTMIRSLCPPSIQIVQRLLLQPQLYRLPLPLFLCVRVFREV